MKECSYSSGVASWRDSCTAGSKAAVTQPVERCHTSGIGITGLGPTIDILSVPIIMTTISVPLR